MPCHIFSQRACRCVAQSVDSHQSRVLTDASRTVQHLILTLSHATRHTLLRSQTFSSEGGLAYHVKERVCVSRAPIKRAKKEKVPRVFARRWCGKESVTSVRSMHSHMCTRSTHTHTHTHTHTRTRTLTHSTHTYTHTLTLSLSHTHAHTRTHTRTRARAHTHTHHHSFLLILHFRARRNRG
jgi:hypothetical protein